MREAQKKQLIRLSGTDDFLKALVFENPLLLKAKTGTWTTDFPSMLELWKWIFAFGTAKKLPVGWERYVEPEGQSEFFAMVGIKEVSMMTKPRDSDGKPMLDIENFPLFFDVDDIEANVPTALPNSVTYVEDDEDRENPVPVKWKDWTYRTSTRVESVGGKNVVGPFNVRDGKSLCHYLAIAESNGSGFSLLTKNDFDELTHKGEE